MRSRLMLEVASELVAADEWPEKQVTIHFRPQGDELWRLCFFASDAPNAVDAVVSGEADIAICNPGGVLAMALRGTGPYKEPIPLRAIMVLPQFDQFGFAVMKQSGITSLAQVKEQRYPLKVSLRGQRDHGNHFLEREVLGALGFSLEDIASWGGTIRYDPGLPSGVATSGANVEVSRLDLVERGEVDAIFDEGIGSWLERGLAAGLRPLSLDPAVVDKLEEMGFCRSVLRAASFGGLPRDVLTIDFSGWPIFTRAEMPSDVVTALCAALDARKARIPWQGEGPLPVERMARDTPDAPLGAPLHPAAEKYWRQRGYLV
jgi:TRAP-type uncharacterized transport system substrate-binding protein